MRIETQPFENGLQNGIFWKRKLLKTYPFGHRKRKLLKTLGHVILPSPVDNGNPRWRITWRSNCIVVFFTFVQLLLQIASCKINVTSINLLKTFHNERRGKIGPRIDPVENSAPNKATPNPRKENVLHGSNSAEPKQLTEHGAANCQSAAKILSRA